MLDQNEVFLSGTIVDVPSVNPVGERQTLKASFKILQKQRYNYNGENREQSNYHRCVAWGQLAEVVGKAAVGSRIEVRGELSHRSWVQDGEKKYMTEVKALNVFMPEESEQPAQQAAPAQGQPTPQPDPNIDDEIPF